MNGLVEGSDIVGVCLNLKRFVTSLRLILLPRSFDGLGSLFGRRVARGQVGARIIEDPASVGPKQLVHRDLYPLRLVDFLGNLL